jgi:hypothetical protein
MAPKRKDDKYIDAGDSRNWLRNLSEYDVMPIGGKGDGQMERKLEAVWKPLLPLFIEKNTALCQHLSTTTGKKFKSDFDAAPLARKWKSMETMYKDKKKAFKVGRHQEAGITSVILSV